MKKSFAMALAVANATKYTCSCQDIQPPPPSSTDDLCIVPGTGPNIVKKVTTTTTTQMPEESQFTLGTTSYNPGFPDRQITIGGQRPSMRQTVTEETIIPGRVVRTYILQDGEAPSATEYECETQTQGPSAAEITVQLAARAREVDQDVVDDDDFVGACVCENGVLTPGVGRRGQITKEIFNNRCVYDQDDMVGQGQDEDDSCDSDDDVGQGQEDDMDCYCACPGEEGQKKLLAYQVPRDGVQNQGTLLAQTGHGNWGRSYWDPHHGQGWNWHKYHGWNNWHKWHTGHGWGCHRGHCGGHQGYWW